MGKIDLEKLTELFKNYIVVANNSCVEDNFMFYGGGDSYSDSYYSDAYSDNW